MTASASAELARRCAVLCGWLAAAAGGCGGDDEPQDIDERVTIDIDVTADRQVDQMTMLVGEVSEHTIGVLSPGMIAAGTPPSSGAAVYAGHPITRSVPRSTRAARFVLGGPPTILPVPPPDAVLVIGYAKNPIHGLTPVTAGMLSIAYVPTEGKLAMRSLELHADLLSHLELWGNPGVCARIDDTTYFVDPLDRDCDGLANGDDCNQMAFCDLDATSPAAQAACTASACGLCENHTPSCALGTRVTCRNVRGQPRIVTCDAGGSCPGAAVCLPADACVLGCGSVTSDPTPCILDEWTMGTQDVHAIHCQLPVTHNPYGVLLCEGGSKIDLPLPFDGCANPRILLGVLGQSVPATVTPPCTVHLALSSPAGVSGRTPLVITMDTAASRATVRLSLDPVDGDCTGVGTCEAVKTTATCEL